MTKNQIEKLLRGESIECDFCHKKDMQIVGQANFDGNEIELYVYCEDCGNDDVIKGTIKEIEWS